MNTKLYKEITNKEWVKLLDRYMPMSDSNIKQSKLGIDPLYVTGYGSGRLIPSVMTITIFSLTLQNLLGQSKGPYIDLSMSIDTPMFTNRIFKLFKTTHPLIITEYKRLLCYLDGYP